MRDVVVGQVWLLSKLKEQLRKVFGDPEVKDLSYTHPLVQKRLDAVFGPGWLGMQYTLAESIGVAGIAEWLTVPSIPAVLEYSQLGIVRRLFTPAELVAWLGGGSSPARGRNIVEPFLPAAVAIPWLYHILESITIEPTVSPAWTVTVRTPLGGADGVLLGIGDREVHLSKKDTLALTEKIKEALRRRAADCNDEFAHWEGHCGCSS